MNNSERKNSFNPLERNTLSPIEKYEKYGRFPTEMVIHFLLIVFCTCQIILIVSEKNNFSRSQEHLIYNMFLDDSDKRSMDYSKIVYLYSLKEIRNHVNSSIHNFFNVKKKSLELVEFTNNDVFSILEFSYIDPTRIDRLFEEADNHPLMTSNLTMPRSFMYKVTNNYLGPFEYDDKKLKMFLNDVVEFRLNYTFKTYIPMYDYDFYACNLWSVNQIYSFASRGHFNLKLDIKRLGCEDINLKHSYFNLFVNKLLWIHIVIIGLALYSLKETWTVIDKGFEKYIKSKTKLEKEDPKYEYELMPDNDKSSDSDESSKKFDLSYYYNPLIPEDLLEKQGESKDSISSFSGEKKDAGSFKVNNIQQLSERRKSQIIKDNDLNNDQLNQGNIKQTTQYSEFEKKEKIENHIDDNKNAINKNKPEPKIFALVSWWQFFCLIGNLIQIFASGMSLSDSKTIFQSTEILVGFGAMFAYINMGRYIEYSNNYSLFYFIIKNSLPNVLRYLLGVTPVFLGFIFFGLCIFWRSERFTSFSDVMIVLFSLAQGDSVFDALKDLSGLYFFIGQIYLYSFCILFIVVVLNIFIALIEEAYIKSRMENKSHWVFDYATNHNKENIDNKSIKEKNNFDNNPPEQSINNVRKNIDYRSTSKSKEPKTFTVKESKLYKESFSPASSLFNKNKIGSLSKNANFPKSLNFRNFPYKDVYTEENSSLSYKQNFSIKDNKK